MNTALVASAPRRDKPPGSQRQRVRKRKPDARLAQLHSTQTHVHRLHQEVESLKLTRALLMDRQLQRADRAGGSFERVVREYFKVFRFGMQLEVPMAPVPSKGKTNKSTESFLRSIMDENVDYAGPVPGVDQFIELNKQYSVAFKDNRLDVLEVKVHPVDGDVVAWEKATVMVSGWGEYSCCITPTTIEMLFPHIQRNHALVAKLIGQHITGVGRYDFVFDTATSRVIATCADLNFVPVFMTALKNPVEVALLLNQAQITPEYCIGSAAEGMSSPRKDDGSSHDGRESSGMRLANLLT